MLGGAVIDKCPDGLSAVINFVCDKKAVWGGHDITQYVVANPNYMDCQVSWSQLFISLILFRLVPADSALQWCMYHTIRS